MLKIDSNSNTNRDNIIPMTAITQQQQSQHH